MQKLLKPLSGIVQIIWRVRHKMGGAFPFRGAMTCFLSRVSAKTNEEISF